jgi:integrase/recombinase XerD
VPSVAGWRGSGLPKALPDGQVTALLASCDRDTAIGLRDFAVLTLLARLGLRAREVAALELDDISWRAGTVLIRGKGRRDEHLPLPSDVGEALAGYLRGGRAAGVSGRRVFLRSRAPGGGPPAAGIKAIVRHACPVMSGLRTAVGIFSAHQESPHSKNQANLRLQEAFRKSVAQGPRTDRLEYLLQAFHI